MSSETNVNGDKLVCRRLFPDDLPRALYFPPLDPINRDYIENLPVVVPTDIESRLSSLSQVSLKDMWLGRREIMSTRWQHSVGVYNLGEIWLKTLFDRGVTQIPCNLQDLNQNAIKVIAGYSLLLHDYGHLFFSHLLEEALTSINWVPGLKNTLSIEIIPLKRRLNYPQSDNEASLVNLMKQAFASANISKIDIAVQNVISLIEGTSGIPWLQSIVNGPVDADKIDYVGRDQQLLQSSGYSVGTRLQLNPILGPTGDGKLAGIMPWFSDFIFEQYINHSGFLCFPGRSAIAAADMWRERIFLYDRFYLAPAIRAADRVVLEILQHFLIRSVISTRFADKIRTKNVSLNSENETFQTLAESMEQNSSPIDVRERKYEACRILLEGMTLNFGKMGRRDFDLLAFMEELLNKWPHIDDKYCRFLHSMYLSLTKLREGSDLKKYANDHIVQRPLQFPREYTQDIRELARSLQHQYYQDVLIDVCVLPNVLSSSPFQAPIGSDASKRFMQLLVPKGDVSKWGPGSRNLEPLNPSKVKELELPYGRVMILSENKNLARSKYIFDQLLGAIQSSGIPIEEVE